MTSPINSFEDLECWKAARLLRIYVAREVASKLPTEEKFHLKTQLLDAARSVTANIAEGYGRYHYLDDCKFCSNARGSCCEVLDHVITACDEGMIPEVVLDEARARVGTTLRLLNGYMAYLKRACRRQPE